MMLRLLLRRLAVGGALLAPVAFYPTAPSRGAELAPKDITFDDLKLDIKKDDPWKPSLLTAGVKKLDGKPVRIRGYILPSFRQSGIKEFVLTRDNMECCFGPGAALHDCIIVDMAGDAAAEFTVRPVTVTGEFAIREKRIDPEDPRPCAIYHLDGKEVK